MIRAGADDLRLALEADDDRSRPRMATESVTGQVRRHLMSDTSVGFRADRLLPADGSYWFARLR